MGGRGTLPAFERIWSSTDCTPSRSISLNRPGRSGSSDGNPGRPGAAICDVSPGHRTVHIGG
eukprot:3738707-Rhodomonas_salina.1